MVAGIFLAVVIGLTDRALTKGKESTHKPLSVPEPQKPSVSSTGKDDATEMARRAAIAKRLGDLLAEGDKLRKLYCAGGPFPDCIARWKKWNARVEQYLKTDVGSDYVARFKASEFMNTAPYAGISQEIIMLNDFIKEFH